MRVLLRPEALDDDWDRMDWPRSSIVFPHVTWDMCVVRGEITRVSFPHEVEVSDVMEVTCSWAQFVHASRAAHALTKRMSICDKFSDDWNSAHMVPDSSVSLETFLRAVTKKFFLHMVTRTAVEIASQTSTLDEEGPIVNHPFPFCRHHAKEFVSVVERSVWR